MLCKTRENRRQGFTLMEVLIVLAILVMLVGMVAPKILSSQKKADLQAAKTQIGSFMNALEHYAMDMKNYPTTEQGLSALITKPSDLDEAAPWQTGGYLNGDAIPKDPWNREYKYEYPPTHGTGDRPDIWSSGPDGEDETDDDITSWTKGAEGEKK